MNITRNVIWLLACRVSGDVLNLVLFIVISRQFGPAGVGAYSYGFAVTGFVFVIGCLGIEEYGLREYARIEEAQRPRLMAELLGAQCVMLGVAVAGVGIYLALTAPTGATLVIIASLGFYQACVAIASTLYIPAMGQQRMNGPALIDLGGRAVAFTFAGVAIYAWHASIPRALLGYLLAGVVLIVLSRNSARRHGGALSVRFSLVALTRILRVLWSFAAVEVLAQLFARVGVIVLSLRIGEAAAGLYATGLRLIEVGLMPLAFIGVAAYPQLSRLFIRDRTAFRSFGLDFIAVVALVGVVLAWALNFVVPTLLVPVLGAKYAGTEDAVRMMAALALVQAVEVGMGRVLFAADLQVARAVSIFLGATGALVLNLLLIPPYGVSGAIVAGVLSFMIIDIAYFAALRGALTSWRLLQSLGLPLSGVLLAGLVAWQSRRLALPEWAQAGASAVAILAVGGIAFWRGHGRQLLAARG